LPLANSKFVSQRLIRLNGKSETNLKFKDRNRKERKAGAKAAIENIFFLARLGVFLASFAVAFGCSLKFSYLKLNV
jgi:hypothetical protein